VPRELVWAAEPQAGRGEALFAALTLLVFASILALAIFGLSLGLHHPGWLGRLWSAFWIGVFAVIDGAILWLAYESVRVAWTRRRWSFAEPNQRADAFAEIDYHKHWVARGARAGVEPLAIKPDWADGEVADSTATVVYEALSRAVQSSAVAWSDFSPLELRPVIFLTIALLRLAARGQIVLHREQRSVWSRAQSGELHQDHSTIIAVSAGDASAKSFGVFEDALADAIFADRAENLSANHEPSTTDGAYRSAPPAKQHTTISLSELVASMLGSSQQLSWDSLGEELDRAYFANASPPPVSALTQAATDQVWAERIVSEPLCQQLIVEVRGVLLYRDDLT
jgi:hypothetical protein